MTKIFVDADACPVKNEIYKVAQRYDLSVILVSNAPLQIPKHPKIRAVVVSERLDAADNWIVDQIQSHDIVITEDIPLAGRCLAKQAEVIGTRGQEFNETAIGSALASREILSHLRDQGVVTGGPRPFLDRDRSLFLQRLDQTIQSLKKKSRSNPVLSATHSPNPSPPKPQTFSTKELAMDKQPTNQQPLDQELESLHLQLIARLQDPLDLDPNVVAGLEKLSGDIQLALSRSPNRQAADSGQGDSHAAAVIPADTAVHQDVAADQSNETKESDLFSSWEDMANQFSADHPELASLVNRVGYLLGTLGI